VWINVNCILAYALHSAGLRAEALALAGDVTRLLAADLRRTGAWHENYDAETGLGLGEGRGDRRVDLMMRWKASLSWRQGEASEEGHSFSRHLAYTPPPPRPVASPGFLSWNMLAAELLPNLKEGRDPFAL